MMRIGLCLLLALGVASVSTTSATAQEGAVQAAPAAAASGPRWEVNWGDNVCMLIRHAGGARGKAFGLRRVPGSGPSDIVTVDPSGSRVPPTTRREVAIVLAPSNERLSGNLLRAGRVPGGNTVIEVLGDDELLDRFAASTGVQVRSGNRAYFEMSYPLPTNALIALRQCEDEALRGWGVDPALLHAVQTRPRLQPGLAMSHADYPADAIASNQQGIVIIRLTVDVEGRVADCGVVVSSTVASLDRQSCAVLQRRGRFTPAMGTDGRPMRSVYVFRIHWRLP